MQISVIIPTLNEAENIKKLLPHLYKCRTATLSEIIVVDGGSTDKTLEIAESLGAKALISPKKGRAAQMNYAAQHAKGDIFYFIHADVLPPKNCLEDIIKAVNAGFPLGCFTYRFDRESWLLSFNALFNKIDGRWNGGGDQTLFVKRSVFESLDGFKDHYIIMEDFDFIHRARAIHPYKLIRNDAIVSARKYDNNGWLRVQLANIIVFTMFRLKCSQKAMKNAYCWMLDYRS